MSNIDLNKLKDDFSRIFGMMAACTNARSGRLVMLEPQMLRLLDFVRQTPDLIDRLQAADALINQYSAENTKMGNDIMRKIVAETAMRQRIIQLESLERSNAAQDNHINQQQDRIDSLEKTNADLGKALCKAQGELKRRDDAVPLMFGICKPDGSAWFDENCVADTHENLTPVLNDLRRDTGEDYFIAPLYADPAAALPPDNVTYFAFSPDYGFDFFKNKQDAINTAQEEIDGYREDRDDGWDEDVRRVAWGVVVQQAQGFDAQGKHHNHSEHTYQTCEYRLEPPLPGGGDV